MGQTLRRSSRFSAVRVVALLCVLTAVASSPALAIGWGPTDFLVTSGGCSQTAVYDQSFVFKGYLDGAFYYNWGIDFNPSGNVVLSQRYPGYQLVLREIGPSGSTVQSINDSSGYSLDIAVHPVSGHIFRSTHNPGGVREYTPSGTIVRTLNAGTDYYGVAVLPGNILWAGRYGAIDVFDLTSGTITATINIGANGHYYPYSMFYSQRTNTVLMSDGSNGDVFERAADGSFLRRFDSPYNDSYLGVTRGPNEDIYATSAYNGGVVRWSSDGTFQGLLIASGSCERLGILWAGNIGASIDNVTVIEADSGTTDATFTVTIPTSTQTATLDWTTGNGTAVAPDDYVQANGTLSFAAGETQKTITIQVSGDTLDEVDETLKVVLSNPVNTYIVVAEGTATILDNEPMISIDDVTVTEGASGSTVDAVFTVSLSAASIHTVTVAYATANDTANLNDYNATSGVLTFAPAETSKTVTVTVSGDDLDDLDPETFHVNLSNSTTAGIADAQGIGSIVDDDASPTLSIDDVAVQEYDRQDDFTGLMFTVTLSAPTGRDQVTVDFATANGTATAGPPYQAGTDYFETNGTLNFPEGTITQNFWVTVAPDILDEDDETLFVNLTNPRNEIGISDPQGIGTILDNDLTPTLSVGDVSVIEGNDGSRNASFTVSLGAISGRTVSFDYATADGSASGVLGPQREIDLTGNRDYQATSGSITIPAGSSTSVVNVLVNGDRVAEPTETFFLNLSNASNVTLLDAQATGTIIDDDTNPALSIADVSMSEGNSGSSNATFTVTLSSNSDRGVTVDYATVDGSAAAGSDYTTASGTLSFGPDVLTRTFTVEILGDNSVEADEGFVVNLSNATNATIGDGEGAGTITNDDTDVPSILSLLPRTGHASGGTSVTLTGTNFRSGASVLFGTNDATDESVTSSTEMTATTPALTAATLYSVKVTNSDGTTVTRVRSYFADFTDVPASNLFHDFIVKLAVNNVTVGCAAGTYCPTANVNRTQMAIFISRSALGGDANVPTTGMVGSSPYVCGTGGTSVFSDVPPSNAFCKQIHYVASRGIMPGCTGTQFCTTPEVLRDAMAGFIARAIVTGGDANVPIAYTDAITGRSYDLNTGNVNFTDMADNAYTRHAHYIWAKGIIDGCGAGTTYCPTDTVNRAAMAKFLSNAFGLTWP